MDPSWQWPQYPRREAPPPATRPVWPRRSVRFPEFPGDLVEHLAEGRQLRSSTAAASQSAPLDITKLVQQTTGVITGVAELALIGAAFMLAIGQALVGNHLAHDRPWTPPMKIGTGGKFVRSKSRVPPFAVSRREFHQLFETRVGAGSGRSDGGARPRPRRAGDEPPEGPAAISSASRLCPN